MTQKCDNNDGRMLQISNFENSQWRTTAFLKIVSRLSIDVIANDLEWPLTIISVMSAILWLLQRVI